MSDMRILVVEDEPDGQEVFAEVLTNSNMTADLALTAEEALTYLAQNDYSGVVIDLALPGMDGWGLLKVIRNNPVTAQLPCIAVTAYHTSKVKQQAIQSGFDGYFAKPFNPVDFIQILTT